jgi:hypothetical protein
MRDATRKLDHFKPALDVALRVGDDFAVLRREQFGQLLHVRFHEPLELEHHARATLRVRAAPAGERLRRRLHRRIDVRHRGDSDLGLDLAGVGVENVSRTARGRLDRFAADEAFYRTHVGVSLISCGAGLARNGAWG